MSTFKVTFDNNVNFGYQYEYYKHFYEQETTKKKKPHSKKLKINLIENYVDKKSYHSFKDITTFYKRDSHL